ncbi:unnamed protein product [Orchesella dallaii]|uniref:Uncharacterized protein n=1 Tax=Orchesella dallaii TaxID=48710 RepID=A0ABP1Q1K8_9HEXA
MFLFSKKFLLLLVAMTLLFGGEHQLAKALKCHECSGYNGFCDPYHTGTSKDCHENGACAMRKDEKIISKYCEPDNVVWVDEDDEHYGPKCSMSECYCTTDNCNKPKNFGMPGWTGGTDKVGGSTTVADSLTTNGALRTRS